MNFKYSFEKNAHLCAQRGIGFEEIIQAIADGHLLGVEVNPNFQRYPNQEILYVKILQEVYIVPFVIEPNGDLFLKTLYPSRKARKALLDH